MDKGNKAPVFGTPQEQLAEVDKAIYRILAGGQSYRIGTKSLTRADLSMLYEMQQALRSEVANQGDSPLFGDTVAAVFSGR